MHIPRCDWNGCEVTALQEPLERVSPNGFDFIGRCGPHFREHPVAINLPSSIDLRPREEVA